MISPKFNDQSSKPAKDKKKVLAFTGKSSFRKKKVYNIHKYIFIYFLIKV